MKDLTEKQRSILKFIWDKIENEQKPPTLREIGQYFNFSSTQTVRQYLQALSKKGYIRITKARARAIELVRERLLRVPIIGAVRAGPAELAFEDVSGYVELDKFLFNQETFALKIKGDSLKGIGVFEDDLVLVQRQSSAMHNEIVVALINDEATAKILKIRGGSVTLEPANDKYPSIPVNENVQIIGKVITVIRHV